MNEKTLAIIVAGGCGSRLSGMKRSHPTDSALPKQYMLLSEKCILDHAVENFTSHSQIDHVMVVIHRNDEEVYNNLVSRHNKLLPVVFGGKTRQQSVHCGLIAAQKLGFGGPVLIHDGVRPFVEAETISSILDSISPGNCAIPAHPVIDTLKKCGKQLEVLETISRQDIYCAQTPQGFMADEILAVHNNATENGDDNHPADNFTDDASMFEMAGLGVKLVISSSQNFKITTPEDLQRARDIVSDKTREIAKLHTDIRTGNGYDVHALSPGDEITLCGHKIPFDKCLKGHSDADAALHALTDALLGTIGAGDIGSHFPPSDPQWKGAASDVFLKSALAMVDAEGGIINNVDLTIICEAPKIDPHRKAMRENLAKLCKLELNRVSVKATTNEKLGFLGRQEGIATIATTTISFGTRT
ncbi:MAG: bifunctional 2-C-methyl-D-erythritol 4-phosphate cytidylyltransferase/2-C-methyl-D-erythritol 2,4-cyclodiphosphate synthase [Hyphomicrobiales bacterium]|nr:bifunctional 2-C-methyl-D-erythritol 4-phosphate cytidylyltransferase/2-C-methyl-D-erythritol 2,4-cyclodiphosphate synthase [Hyphomicrobiales bacterium]